MFGMLELSPSFQRGPTLEENLELWGGLGLEATSGCGQMTRWHQGLLNCSWEGLQEDSWPAKAAGKSLRFCVEAQNHAKSSFSI